jgi:hypothetical protein
LRRASFRQVKMPALLALNADDGTVSGFLVGLPIQGHADRKACRRVVSDDLNARNGLAPGPMSNGIQALSSERPVA